MPCRSMSKGIVAPLCRSVKETAKEPLLLVTELKERYLKVIILREIYNLKYRSKR